MKHDPILHRIDCTCTACTPPQPSDRFAAAGDWNGLTMLSIGIAAGTAIAVAIDPANAWRTIVELVAMLGLGR